MTEVIPVGVNGKHAVVGFRDRPVDANQTGESISLRGVEVYLYVIQRLLLIGRALRPVVVVAAADSSIKEIGVVKNIQNCLSQRVDAVRRNAVARERLPREGVPNDAQLAVR
jgi:hypothetical protein